MGGWGGGASRVHSGRPPPGSRPRSQALPTPAPVLPPGPLSGQHGLESSRQASHFLEVGRWEGASGLASFRELFSSPTREQPPLPHEPSTEMPLHPVHLETGSEVPHTSRCPWQQCWKHSGPVEGSACFWASESKGITWTPQSL